MTLVKTKTKVSSSKRKLSAGHHRQSRRYLKTYWPYIPIITVLGGALVANQYLPVSFHSSQLTKASSSTRFASLTGIHSSFLIGLISLLLVLLSAYYLIRHFKRLRSLIINGERYLVKHYVLDMAFAVLISGLYILVR